MLRQVLNRETAGWCGLQMGERKEP